MVTTTVCSLPHATNVTSCSSRASTRVGVAVELRCPSPSCPAWFAPHDHTFPLSVTTTVCAKPHATLADARFSMLGTMRGSSSISVITSWPSWPSHPRPQVYTSPSSVITAEWLLPAARQRTFLGLSGSESGRIEVGVWRLLVCPSPSCPYLFFPHAYTFFLDVIARLCHAPTITSVKILFLQFLRRGTSGSQHCSIGVGWSRVLKSRWPSWPSLLLPHENGRPSSVIQTEWSVPHATTVIE
mmetsp:Transcript_26870/g.64114  ORF Transcript_26870/g.64114 Transcript_26870/m.64114 type:complete len:242 (-) Transcript_26870:1979-2704(-)